MMSFLKINSALQKYSFLLNCNILSFGGDFLPESETVVYYLLKDSSTSVGLNGDCWQTSICVLSQNLNCI